MHIPLLKKYFSMEPLGHAFMAYRTVNPYALGKARQSSADLASVSSEYAYSGVPDAVSIHDWASSGVRKLEDVGGSACRAEIVDMCCVLMGANASMVDAMANTMAKLGGDNFMVAELLLFFVARLVC